MSELTKHIGGYHGTSYELARAIIAEGFDGFGRPICFAPIDDAGLELAKEYGLDKARKLGERTFSIVQAAFDATIEEYDSLGRPQIEIPDDESRYIQVMHYTLDFPTTQDVLDIADSARHLG